MNKFVCAMAVFAITSCSFLSSKDDSGFAETCPLVRIPRNSAYVIQKVNYIDDFQIELTGYSGYCYFDKRVNRRKAVIIPQFEVKRLRGKSDETDVDFEYYTQTIKGPPEYLGKKQYFGHVTIPLERRKKSFEGKRIELKIPNENYKDFTINLGLELTKEEQKYNNRTFDINFKYEENE